MPDERNGIGSSMSFCWRSAVSVYVVVIIMRKVKGPDLQRTLSATLKSYLRYVELRSKLRQS